MPTPTTLALFAVACLALIAIPVPNMIYVVTRSVSQGRAAGYASALGVELATLVHVGAATVGLSALVASSATAFDMVRYGAPPTCCCSGCGRSASRAFRPRSTAYRSGAHGLGSCATG